MAIFLIARGNKIHDRREFSVFAFWVQIFWMLLSILNTWLIMNALNYLIKTGSRRWKKCLMFCGCFLLDTIIIYIGDPDNILAVLPCFLSAVLLACEGSLWKKITVGTMYASTFFSFNALRDNFLRPFTICLIIGCFPDKYHIHVYSLSEIYPIDYSLLIRFSHTQFIQIFSAVSNFLFAAFLYAGIRKFAPDKDYSLSDSLWRLLFLLTATPFGVVLSVVVLFNKTELLTDINQSLPAKYAVLLAISLLSFVSLLWCIAVLAKQQKLEQRNLLSETNRKYYEAMEQQHFEIRRLKHDLANHMQILSALPAGQREAYLKKLAQIPAIMEPLAYCGDATVNAVLSVKKAAMDRCGIRMELSMDIPEELPFDKADVCALYANAADNAIEACLKLEEEKRTITIKGSARKGLFCLKVSNPVPHAAHDPKCPDLGASGSQKQFNPLKSGHLPPTTKEDKANHGFGLKSIEEIVARYHGRMELNTEDGIFSLFLYIPL